MQRDLLTKMVNKSIVKPFQIAGGMQGTMWDDFEKLAKLFLE